MVYLQFKRSDQTILVRSDLIATIVGYGSDDLTDITLLSGQSIVGLQCRIADLFSAQLDAAKAYPGSIVIVNKEDR